MTRDQAEKLLASMIPPKPGSGYQYDPGRCDRDSDAREVRGRLCDVCLRGSIPCAVDPPAWLCDLNWPSSREEHFRIGYERYRNGANGVVVEPSLAQRILAALEESYSGGFLPSSRIAALAAELRALVTK